MHWLKRKKILIILLILLHEVKPKKLLRTTKNLHEYNSKNSYLVIEQSSLRNVSLVTNQPCHIPIQKLILLFILATKFHNMPQVYELSKPYMVVYWHIPRLLLTYFGYGKSLGAHLQVNKLQ